MVLTTLRSMAWRRQSWGSGRPTSREQREQMLPVVRKRYPCRSRCWRSSDEISLAHRPELVAFAPPRAVFLHPSDVQAARVGLF